MRGQHSESVNVQWGVFHLAVIQSAKHNITSQSWNCVRLCVCSQEERSCSPSDLPLVSIRHAALPTPPPPPPPVEHLTCFSGKQRPGTNEEGSRCCWWLMSTRLPRVYSLI